MPENENRGPDDAGSDDPGLGPTMRQGDLDRGATLRSGRSATTGRSLDSEETIRGRKPGERVFSARYELRRILGRGGLGVVWLARDHQLEREVALKFLPEVVAFNEGTLADLKRETRRALDLTHPHIVRVHDLVTDGENAAISMEYVDGKTLLALRALKEQGVFEVDDIREWVRQLCEALEYAHGMAKVVHRDLKPMNLMVIAKGHLKITDFGISRSLEESVNRSTKGSGSGFSGTLAYMSPQQLESKPSEPSDDLYAVGATIYELLTGKPPFYGGEVSRLIRKVTPPSMAKRREELRLEGCQSIPQAWEAVVAACLAKEPAQRPASARAVWAGLEGKDLGHQGTEITAGEGRDGTRCDPGREAGRLEAGGTAGWKPAVRKDKWLALVALLVLVALGAWWWGPGKKGADSSTAPKQPHEAEAKAKSEQEAAAKIQAQREAEERTKQEEARKAALAVGGVKFTTEPTGATVRLGQEVKSSPASFVGLKPGKHPYSIELAGYESEQGELLIVSGVDRQMPVFTLVRSKGDLTIELNPSNAEYEVRDAEGRALKSGTGNGELTALAAGQYRVKASHATLGEVTQTVEVKGKAKALAKLALPYGTLKVTSEPSGAKVLQEGKELGTTPKMFSLVKPGQVSLRLEMEGYKPDAVSGMVADGHTLELAAKLESTGPKPGEALKNRIGMELVWIAPGRFTMGSPASEVGRDDNEGPQTEVTLTKGYWLGKYEVTESDYVAVMGTGRWNTPEIGWRVKQLLPMVNMTWYEAVEFCQKLTERERNSGKLPAGYEYRLPTEAQWEYACRAGTTTRFSGGDDDGQLGEWSWYWDSSRSGGERHRVGKKQPNAWGLYDMHGNMWEWCSDRFGNYPGGSVTDPTGANSGLHRVIRGGGMNNPATDCRSARRTKWVPDDGWINGHLGFRAALVPVQ